MALNKEKITLFQSLYKKHFWIEITEKEALEKWTSVITFIQNILLSLEDYE